MIHTVCPYKFAQSFQLRLQLIKGGFFCKFLNHSFSVLGNVKFQNITIPLSPPARYDRLRTTFSREVAAGYLEAVTAQLRREHERDEAEEEGFKKGDAVIINGLQSGF